MVVVQKNIKLAPYTTLKIGGSAKYFAMVKTKTQLLEAIFWAKERRLPIFILGGGSNTLFSDKGFNGLVIANHSHGISLVKEDKDYAWVEAASGELWSALVNYCLKNKYYGAENLFLIPGTVGAAPIQNIGAYGVELKDIFASLIAVEIKTGQEKKFSPKDCQFGYRQSVFKNKLKNKYFIHSVTLKLSKKPHFVLGYGDIQEKLKRKKPITAPDVVKVIMEIRNSKLPNPAVLPSAGSFFQNPEISLTQFKALQKKYPDIKYFAGEKGKIKVPAGWLIEQCGFKGKRIKNVGVYEKQALVLVNYGGAKATELLALAKKIEDQVAKKFGIKLKKEVNVI
jgi:UDP-N-acetylmuramate dehydrogenase